ncbi:MAG: hypothetical protein KJO23_06165 [Bacteroidia bacterium]|nr:hypothetical protein [Bacteroidia bacterium]
MNAQYFAFAFPLIELIAALFATIHYKKYRNSNEKYFLYFLWFTFLVDGTGVIRDQLFSLKSTLLYSLFVVIGYLFYFYWYYTVLRSRKFRQTAVVAAILFISITLVTYLKPSLQGQGYAFVTGAIGLLILTFFHFYQLIRSDEVLIVKYKLSFWISTALLLFYIGILPLMLLAEFIDIKGMNYQIILLSLNIILYGCYVIGFIWTKKKYNRF